MGALVWVLGRFFSLFKDYWTLYIDYLLNVTCAL